MLRLQYYFGGDAFADGAGGDKFLIDLSDEMSQVYGRLIRQGQIFKVSGVDVRIVNPNTVLQDEVMALSGKFLYFHPTGPRKKAWLNAFKATQTARRYFGEQTKSPGYDFRVGLASGYSTDVGAGNEGVRFNAWLNAADDPLQLTNTVNDRDIFGVYNGSLIEAEAPRKNTDGGFGGPFQKDADALLDVLDYVTNDSDPIIEQLGAASDEAQSVPFMVSFTSLYESAAGATEAANSVTNADHIDGPLDVMCGLLGVYIDTTTIDDDLVQSQDWGLEVSIEVESWTPIMKKSRKSKRSKR